MPEHVVVYKIDDEEAFAFSDMGTDFHEIRQEFPDWAPAPVAIRPLLSLPDQAKFPGLSLCCRVSENEVSSGQWRNVSMILLLL